jgi:hypothetical protein
MDLFQPQVSPDKQHDIFRLLMHPAHAPERAVIASWATGFVDRDGKFVKEFQTTFESSFWELYLHAMLKHLGMSLDYSFHAPDLVVTAPTPFTMEATIAAPPHGGAPAHGVRAPEIPQEFGEFNRQAILRLCSSFTSKVRRYRQHYATLDHVRDLPYVIAIAPFDRPQAHLAANRPILAALYGIYYDEDETIANQSENVISHEIDAVYKHATANVPVGMFVDDAYKDVSAVVFGPLATWGKVRALADAPQRNIEFTTLHPSGDSGLMPEVRTAMKADYVEHLLDGLYVFHNPFAERPLPPSVFDHPRLARFEVDADGSVHGVGPDDFLLMRMLISKERTFKL